MDIEKEITVFVQERFPDVAPDVIFLALVKAAARLCLDSITPEADRARMDLEGFSPRDKAGMIQAIKPFQHAIQKAFGDV